MTIASAEVLGSHLRPLGQRDNHVMKYESVPRQIPETVHRSIAVSRDAAFDMTLLTDITRSLECPATLTLSTNPA